MSIYYKGETIDVSGKDSYSIDKPDESNISFMLSNSEITTRTVNFKMDFIERPSISFSADKSKLRSGRKEQSTLSWNIENARKAYLIIADNRTEIPLIGNQTVYPDVTTNYIVEAQALDNESYFSEELQIGVFYECAISFSADKEYVFPSLPVLLTWNVTNATKVWLGSEEVEPCGSKTVEPTSDTVYILQAKDQFGMKNERLTVKTFPIKQANILLASPPNFTIKQTFTINRPKYNVEVKFPTINIDWITVEVPKVKSLTEAGLFQKLSPPLPKTSFNLMSSIKKVFNHIIRK
ncbi:MAG: hypothetical protein IJ081_02260 [Prevotella sp.]|nr:hypothetical protein [Prevotella sp.]